MARDILSTLRLMLAKAEDPACTPAERDAFLDKAQAMMTAHAIESHMLGMADPKQREGIVKVRLLATTDKATLFIKAKRELLSGLAEVNQCRTVIGAGRAWLDVIGHASDVEMVQVMFASIMIQLQTALAAAERVGEVAGRTARVSYAHGYVRRVYGRLTAAKRAAASDSTTPGTALVLVDRTALVSNELPELYPNLSNRTFRCTDAAHNDPNAFRTGDRDGLRADLGGNAVRSGDNDRKEIGS